MIPSKKRCLEYMDRYGMPPHIRDHSLVVERISTFLVQSLRESGVVLSMELVQAGALMHDIAKFPCLDSGEDHSSKGMEICISNGLDEIAVIVGEHVRMRDYRPEGPITEKEIVYYADKRVNHDMVVSLDKRLEYLVERYGKGVQTVVSTIIRNFELCREVEKKIFARLQFGPEELNERI